MRRDVGGDCCHLADNGTRITRFRSRRPDPELGEEAGGRLSAPASARGNFQHSGSLLALVQDSALAKARTVAGLDVHATKIVAAVLDVETGELSRVAAMPDDELLAIDRVGPGMIRVLREAIAELRPDQRGIAMVREAFGVLVHGLDKVNREDPMCEPLAWA